MRQPLSSGMALALTLTLAGAGNAQDVSPVTSLRVVDADDKTLGHVPAGRWIDGATDLRVEVPLLIDDSIFRVLVGRNQLEIIDHRMPMPAPVPPDFEEHEDPLYYQAADCTGLAFLNLTGVEQDLFTRGAVAPPGQTIYVQQVPGPVYPNLNVRSALHADGTCESYPTAQTLEQVAYAEPLVDLLEHFRPPFRLVPGASPCPMFEATAAGITRLRVKR